MSVDKLRDYLTELLAGGKAFDARVVATFKDKAEDRLGVSDDEWKFLAEEVLCLHRDRFVDEATRRDLEHFLARELKPKGSPLEILMGIPVNICNFTTLFIEALRGQLGQIFADGTASPEDIAKVRREAAKINFRGTVSLAKIAPQTEDARTIEAALRKAIEAIHGFDFLSQVPQGKEKNEHTILIKVGVNWGEFGYPTITSWQSVYALTRMCLQEAARRGAAVEVIVGDESGVEVKFWAGATMDNFERTGILQAAVLAGLEGAASLEGREPAKFDGARQLLQSVMGGQSLESVMAKPKVTRASLAMLDMARRAGVRIMAFEEPEVGHQRIPVPGAKHFTQGILAPRIVAKEVTDIINLPKPPGRHLVMGNTGLTGALKNYIGLLAGKERTPTEGWPGLHGPYDRYPKPKKGETGESYREGLKALRKAILDDRSGAAARLFAQEVRFNWETQAPAMPFHEKVAELYAAFAEKERFSATDMRRTLSSMGPDMGDNIDIGAVIAARDPLSLDVLAGALLKWAYEGYKKKGSLPLLPPGGDTWLEYLMGKTWLRSGTSFDLLSHIAANSYGLGPIDLAHLDFEGLDNSGFSREELEAIISYLS